MLISPSLGRAKENSLGGTGGIPAFITSWLVRKTTVLEQSVTAVSLNRTREWESSKGGRTPDPRHGSRKSLKKRETCYLCSATRFQNGDSKKHCIVVDNLPFPFHTRDNKHNKRWTCYILICRWVGNCSLCADGDWRSGRAPAFLVGAVCQIHPRAGCLYTVVCRRQHSLENILHVKVTFLSWRLF